MKWPSREVKWPFAPKGEDNKQKTLREDTETKANKNSHWIGSIRIDRVIVKEFFLQPKGQECKPKYKKSRLARQHIGPLKVPGHKAKVDLWLQSCGKHQKARKQGTCYLDLPLLCLASKSLCRQVGDKHAKPLILWQQVGKKLTDYTWKWAEWAGSHAAFIAPLHKATLH